jgi:exodeoxyribonuclease V alpha subunit
VIPLTPQCYAMLARNLFYTNVTRSKRPVVLVGQRRALAIGPSCGNGPLSIEPHQIPQHKGPFHGP